MINKLLKFMQITYYNLIYENSVHKFNTIEAAFYAAMKLHDSGINDYKIIKVEEELILSGK